MFQQILFLLAIALLGGEAITSISGKSVTYNVDDTMPIEAIAGMSYVAEILDLVYQFDHPININVTFGGTPNGVLGLTIPSFFEPENIMIASALYKQISTICYESPKACDVTDAEIIMNQGASWYWGTDGHPPVPLPWNMQYDFVTSFLHESHHAMGFYSSLGERSSSYTSQYTDYTFSSPINSYDQSLKYNEAPIVNSSESEVTPEIYDMITSNKVEIITNNDTIIDIYSPSTISIGISLSHENSKVYDPNKCLMCPVLAPGVAIHKPEIRVIEVMQLLGWKVNENYWEFNPSVVSNTLPEYFEAIAILMTWPILIIVIFLLSGLLYIEKSFNKKRNENRNISNPNPDV
jgi:hypothetical protein